MSAALHPPPTPDRGERPLFPELVARGAVYFVGIGGSGMLALAELVARRGGKVAGSDRAPEPAARALASLGIPVGPDTHPGAVEGASALVISAAVLEDHAQVRKARELGIPVLKRAVALGEWVNRGTVVAVGGTHGKTTTTAMATEVLAAGGLDPVGLVGGAVAGWGGNLRPGASELYVVEADEYDRSFHTLSPSVAVVTSVEADHLDIYGTLEGVREAFRAFAGSLREGGRLLVCTDDPGASALLPLFPAGSGYGLSAGTQLRGVEVETDARASRFRVVEEGEDRGLFSVAAPGVHNVRNALAAAGVGRALGVEWGEIREGLSRYRGVRRRFQWLGEEGGVGVVDDYAHHPTELKAALAAARSALESRGGGGRLVAVFQPHLFSRTRDFHREFGEALRGADRVWVTDIYPAREAPLEGVTGALVAEAVEDPRVRVTYHPTLDGVAEAVAEELRAGDLVITLGAGSVERVGPALLQLLREGARV